MEIHGMRFIPIKSESFKLSLTFLIEKKSAISIDID